MTGTQSQNVVSAIRAMALLVAVSVVVSSCTTGNLGDDGDPQSAPAPIQSTTVTATSTPSGPSTPSDTSTTAATTTTSAIPLGEVPLAVEIVDTGFDNPVLLVADPSGGPDFVVEQVGSIVRADSGDHAEALDISDDVVFSGEQGLLGLAFHPGFLENGLAYVTYVAPGPRTIVEQFEVSNGVFDLESRTEILRVRQPAANHNGGMIAFGPDGHLWIALGDGGGSNDRFENGQDQETLLGSMLRIAVGVAGVDTYAVPADNPFADGREGAPEIWAIGLRNPWRFAFDGDDVWIADVGQARVEEVSVVSARMAGLNFGWNVLEGSSCFRSDGCDFAGFVLPITEYSHDEGCSITGGVVYRGEDIPSLSGQFFYSDYCTGILRSISTAGDDNRWTEIIGGGIDRPTGFGVGGDGEVYIVTQNGELLKLVERDG